MDNHQFYMQHCLDLAARAIGHVAPNPMVGSIIVHNGNIIGEGYHRQFGEPHAEVNAVNSVSGDLKQLLSESTLYVNLEPCSHHGKTPPCADMIISNKIAKVVIGSNDPNPLVVGKGIQKLRDAGIEVITGILKSESDFLNRRFMTAHLKHRPYIILKWAESADGFMAPNEPKHVWLTNAHSKKLVHQWRSEEQAIMVGKNTVEVDDPELTVRLVEGKNPVRIVIDRTLSISLTKKIFNPGDVVYIFNELKDRIESLIHFVQVDFSLSVLPQILKNLASKGIQSIIVEGGSNTLQQFIDQNLWDEARIFTAPVTLNAGIISPKLDGKLLEEQKIDTDKLRVILNDK